MLVGLMTSLAVVVDTLVDFLCAMVFAVVHLVGIMLRVFLDIPSLLADALFCRAFHHGYRNGLGRNEKGRR